MDNKYKITYAFFGSKEHINYINSTCNPTHMLDISILTNVIVAFLESEQIKKVVVYYTFTSDFNINLSNIINKTITVQQGAAIQLPTTAHNTANVFDITEVQQATLLLLQ